MNDDERYNYAVQMQSEDILFIRKDRNLYYVATEKGLFLFEKLTKLLFLKDVNDVHVCRLVDEEKTKRLITVFNDAFIT